MPINLKALYASLLAALPAPLVLALVLMGTDAELSLGSISPVVAYLIAFVVFAVVAFIATRLATLGQGSRASKPSKPKKKARGSDSNAEEGTVKWFNVKKGFGFITRDSGGDVFVHFRAIEGEGRRALRQGQRVRYTVVEAEKGLQANDVVTLDDE